MKISKPLHKMIPRGSESTGNGWYGASRGSRKHKGCDYIANKGDCVSSVIDGTISKIGYAYAHALQFRYVEVINDVYRWRLMYIEPLSDLYVGQRVVSGQNVGEMLDIAEYWNRGKTANQSKMKNHLHTQVWKHGLLTDPEPIFELLK